MPHRREAGKVMLGGSLGPIRASGYAPDDYEADGSLQLAEILPLLHEQVLFVLLIRGMCDGGDS